MKRIFKIFIAVSAALIIFASVPGRTDGDLDFFSTCFVSAKERPVKIGIIADVHYRETSRGNITNGTCTLSELKRVDENMTLWGADIKIQLGDFVDGCNQSGNCDNVSELNCELVKKRVSEILPYWSGKGYYSVLGNHEISSMGCTKAKMASLLGMPRNYYSFDYRGFHFIIMDDSIGIKNSSKHSIGVAQMAWLKSDLNKTRYPAIIFAHVPLSSDFRIEYDEVVDEKDFRKSINGSAVIAVIFGHSHHEGNIHIEGHENIENGIRYYYIPSFTSNYALSIGSHAQLSLDSDSFNLTITTNRGNLTKRTPYNFTIDWSEGRFLYFGGIGR